MNGNLTSHSELQALVRLANEQGWVVESSGGGHLVWSPPFSTRPVLTSKTPSDVWAMKHIRDDLAKAGLILNRADWKRQSKGAKRLRVLMDDRSSPEEKRKHVRDIMSEIYNNPFDGTEFTDGQVDAIWQMFRKRLETGHYEMNCYNHTPPKEFTSALGCAMHANKCKGDAPVATTDPIPEQDRINCPQCPAFYAVNEPQLLVKHIEREHADGDKSGGGVIVSIGEPMAAPVKDGTGRRKGKRQPAGQRGVIVTYQCTFEGCEQVYQTLGRRTNHQEHCQHGPCECKVSVQLPHTKGDHVSALEAALEGDGFVMPDPNQPGVGGTDPAPVATIPAPEPVAAPVVPAPTTHPAPETPPVVAIKVAGIVPTDDELWDLLDMVLNGAKVEMNRSNMQAVFAWMEATRTLFALRKEGT